MDILGIIPARYNSTRYPGKPLIKIGGKTMIRRVYERCTLSLKNILVATDDERIKREIENFGGNVIMTSPEHKSGTDRCAEALTKYKNRDKSHYDVVINIQGDEPYLDPISLPHLAKSFTDPDIQISTLIMKISTRKEIFDPNVTKVIFNNNRKAMYFSRSAIPYLRNVEKNKWVKTHDFYKHIGIYAFRNDILQKITQLPLSTLEKAESLEQNRWLENGFSIHIEETFHETISIDTPEDLEKINNLNLL